MPGTGITSRKTSLNKDQPCIPACGESRVLVLVGERDGHDLVWSKTVEDLGQDSIQQTSTE